MIYFKYPNKSYKKIFPGKQKYEAQRQRSPFLSSYFIHCHFYPVNSKKQRIGVIKVKVTFFNGAVLGKWLPMQSSLYILNVSILVGLR